MYSLIKIGFEYQENRYEALVRVKQKSEGIDYEITIMNGDLEKLLYGNHVIKQRNGSLLNESNCSNEQLTLQQSIAEALSHLYQVPLEQNIPYPAKEESSIMLH